jgi:hypothetical protein
VSKQTAYDAAPEEQDLGRSIEGVGRLREVRTVHVGRFSEGNEDFPKTPDKLHQGRFSEGVEQLPETPGKLHVGRFSDGIEQLPETARELRRGSFADGYKQVRERRSHGLSRRHLRRPEAQRRHTRRVRGGRTGTGA